MPFGLKSVSHMLAWDRSHYLFEEYVVVSDEIKSWREFGPYVAGVVSRFGRDSL